MIVLCTYCSADKNKDQNPLPAIERYISERINKVHSLAILNKKKFFILSGKFGLLQAEESIAYYDHLLMKNESEAHSHMISKQIDETGISKIIFYSRSIQHDPKVKTYLECIQLATAKSKIELEIVEDDFTD